MANPDEDALVALAPDLDPGTRRELLRFTALIRQWSKKTDLVRVRSAQELAELLFLDALALAPVLPREARVIDVGAGAGAPAIPLAILRPDLHLTMLEPRRRRVMFMRLAAGSLGLGGRTSVEEGRLDDPPADHHAGTFDAAYSRATFAPPEWVARGTALAPLVVALLAREEAPAPPDPWRHDATHDYQVPSSGAPRSLAVYAR